MTIYVSNYKTYDGEEISILIGRPSIFGNPYTHLKGKTIAKFKVSTREEAVSKYRDYFYKMIETQKVWRDELFRIKELSKTNDIHLMCWCKPLACHGDIIKEYLDQMT